MIEDRQHQGSPKVQRCGNTRNGKGLYLEKRDVAPEQGLKGVEF